MKTTKKISFYQADKITLDSGIRNPNIAMFDIKTNRMFGTTSVHITANGIEARSARGDNKGSFLYEFSDEYKKTKDYTYYMQRFGITV